MTFPRSGSSICVVLGSDTAFDLASMILGQFNQVDDVELAANGDEIAAD